MKKVMGVLTGGFAIFAMFFGAGNLIFPLEAGKLATSSFFPAFSGLALTGILVPLLGLIATLIYNGNYQDFFDRFGKIPAFLLILFLLLLMGPFGALPRCLTVAFGSFSMLFPDFPLMGFSFIMTGAVFLLCLNENQVVPLMGAILAPAKIISVGLILLFGLLFATTPETGTIATSAAFEDGISKGYQMMDLLASFFFATVIVRHFQVNFNVETNGSPFWLSLYAILIGSGLLLIIYFALIYLGATFANDLDQNAPEQFLSVIAYLTLGNFGGNLVSVAIILSCLTTVIALTTVFSDYLFEHIFKKRLQRLYCLILTCIVTFCMSNLGFRGIVSLLTPILSYLYPLLIGLTLLNITTWAWRQTRFAKSQVTKNEISIS
ncbi:MAG: branched-chain amino acid transport system II carrier protein [Alphaproteobacteria bacterium]|nr:branched-chain amino acid transport system II carrier protein [Alphaproteobacteria bacterium]